jgi:hypothetical protein
MRGSLGLLILGPEFGNVLNISRHGWRMGRVAQRNTLQVFRA